MGALAGYLATSPSSLFPAGGEGQASSLGKHLKKAAAVASHSVTARGTQVSYVVGTLRRDLLISHS